MAKPEQRKLKRMGPPPNRLIDCSLEGLSEMLGGAVAQRDLNTEDLRDLLRLGPVRFVVGNIGHPLRFVPEADCYDFWKQEVQPRVIDTDGVFYLEDFEGEYCYAASIWDDGGASPLVVLLMHH